VDDYELSPRGILYLECASEETADAHHTLRELNEATGSDQPIATLDCDYVITPSVSPDGQTVIYGCSSWGTSDVMMIENFR
jgi:hypothetical protein